ncbi:dienelactone hydrolase family protein [Flavobacterium selenitireducens]|uniref:dienelactone hydrolase family protein n=1 Tax=Flavobacterium selenitireducens TaxID=2722704 RepID=UPI00168B7FE4|nr:dienelactone hydrolase family protein [Flavobacterium selenitireducens]MBD3581376.1 dienelactone hydrolase family protein [Flavobacterium selenitireducens]
MKSKTFASFLLLFASLSIKAQLKPIAYSDGSQKLNGVFVASGETSAAKPGILILSAWMGIQDHEKQVAAELSKMGYHVFIADIFGEGNYPKNPSEAGKQAGHYKNNPKDYQRRIQLALDQLVKAGANPDNIVAIGYCFGGTGVLEMARSNMKVKGVASFHGGLGKDKSRPNGAISAKVLILHGADDNFVPKNEIEAFQQEMRDGKADWQMNYYADAVHAFTEKSAGSDKSKGVAYNEKADKRSWEALKVMLDETLKK